MVLMTLLTNAALSHRNQLHGDAHKGRGSRNSHELDIQFHGQVLRR